MGVRRIDKDNGVIVRRRYGCPFINTGNEVIKATTRLRMMCSMNYCGIHFVMPDSSKHP